MDNMERTLIETEARSKSNTHRLDKLETVTAAIHEQTASIKELITEIKHTNEHVEDHDNRLDRLEQRPGEKWDKLTMAGIAAVGSGVVGIVIGLMAK